MSKTKSSANNTALINAVAPIALKFYKNSFDLGSHYCIGNTVIRFPTKVKHEWLNEVCNLNSTITSITYTPEVYIEDFLKNVSTTVSASRLILNGLQASDPVNQARARKVVEDGDKIIDQVTNNNESVGYVSINVLAVGNDKEDAIKKERVIKNKFAGQKFSLSVTSHLQHEVWKAVSPCDLASELQLDIGNQIMPISSMLGGFPFAFSGYNDGEGTYWGKDSSGGLVIIDTWKRGFDRTNSNMVITGVSGAGKSTAVKHLLLNEWALGTKILIIDPQGEYKEFCENVGGDWIDIANGIGGRINPFHIYLKAKDEDEEKKSNAPKLSEVAKHINNLEIFFNLYLNLDEMTNAVLKHCIEITYQKKGITWDTDVLKISADQYPTMNDLYQTCIEQAEATEPTLKRNEENYAKKLSILLRNAAVGSDSFLWNTASTVYANSDVVVFDTSAFNSQPNNIKKTLYHIVLNYCENYLYRDRFERVILLYDEAHNGIDQNIPETVQRLDFIERTVRKFESALWICSQQLGDFLHETVRRYGQSLLDQPNIKLLLPVGQGHDLSRIKELYKLTDAEEDHLLVIQKGKALLSVGKRRFVNNFVIPEHHMSLMGKGGGR